MISPSYPNRKFLVRDMQRLIEDEPKIEKEKKECINIFSSERDKNFLKEYNNINFNYTTIVEYRDKLVFLKQRILLTNRKLFIIKLNKLKSLIYDRSKNDSYILLRDFSLFINPLVSLNFDLITAKLFVNEKLNILTILVLGSTKKFELRFENKQIFDKYRSYISQAIQSSYGFKNNILGITINNRKFFRYLYISQKEFDSKAETGDVLLFRGKRCPAPFQRFWTGEEYDHVAMVKKIGNDIYIYQATVVGKCKLIPWHFFRTQLYNLAYYKIAYRKLILGFDKESTEKIRKKMDEDSDVFIEQTKGKSYALSVGSIICSQHPRKLEEKNEWSKAKGFNCSGLLAACYMMMNILKLTKDSRAFLPGNFSQKDPTVLHFNLGFSLGPEEILDFMEL